MNESRTVKIGDIDVTVTDRVITWRCPLRAIDGDGAPNCYAPHGSGLVTLDNEGNAHKNPKDLSSPFVGVLCHDRDGKEPVIMAEGPYKGYFVAQTAYRGKLAPEDAANYPDSRIVPYVSIPPEIEALGAHLGDAATVREIDHRARRASGSTDPVYKGSQIAALVADVGPHRKLGEGSIALARGCAVPSSPRNGGSDTRLFEWTIYRGTSRPWPVAVPEIAAMVAHAQDADHAC